jgi:PAS domain S-box-containing protein
MNRWQQFAELSNSDGWFWETDRDHRFIWMSDSVEALTGRPPEWYRGKRGADIRQPGIDDSAWRKHLQQIRWHEAFEDFVFDRESPDGIKVLSTSGTPYFDEDGEFQGHRGVGRDLTSHYALTTEVELLGEIINNIDEIVAIWDPNDRLISGNSMYWDLHSSSKERIFPGMLYESYLRAVIPDGEYPDAIGQEEEWIVERLRQHRNPKEPLTMTRRGGRVVELREQRLKTGHTIQISSETTEKVKLLQEAIVARDRLADFAECASDWYWEQDADHRFTMISEKQYLYMGQGENPLLGKTRRENPGFIATDEEWAKHDAIIAARAPLVDFRVQHLVTTGGKRDIAIFGKPIFNENGEFAGYRGIGRDVSQQADMIRSLDTSERDLRQSQALLKSQVHLFESLIATTREGFWNIDNQGRTINLNPAMAEILDRSPEEVLGKTIYDFVDSENRSIFENQLAKRKAGETASYEIALSRPDGSQIACINAATPIYDEDGVKIGSIGLWTDIRAQKRVQGQLEDARAQAENANAAKSEFLSAMSHELRTPLNAIIGFAQLLEMEMDESETGSDDNILAVENISRSGLHLLTLINEILDLSRIEGGHAAISSEVVAIEPVLKDCMTTVSVMAEQRELSTSIKMDAKGPILCDPVRLKQVLLNFLTNAIKYNRPGGSVAISSEILEDRFLRIVIEDTGFGIAAANFDKIFEPFERMGQEKSGIEGTGIGLTITKRIIEAMGGAVGFFSEFGTGSRFWFDLPLAPEGADGKPLPSSRKASLEQEEQANFNKSIRKILYVEDNPANQKLMEMTLSRMGFTQLILAHTGELGIEIAFTQHPALILLDVNLPGADGFEVLRQLRSSEITHHTPVIGISANSMAHDIERARDAGFDAYITKPFDIVELQRTISRFMD